MAGCAVAAGFPSLGTALGWTVFLIALVTGHVDG